MNDSDREIADIKKAFGVLTDMVVMVREDSLAQDQTLADALKVIVGRMGEQTDAIAEIRKVIFASTIASGSWRTSSHSGGCSSPTIPTLDLT